MCMVTLVQPSTHKLILIRRVAQQLNMHKVRYSMQPAVARVMQTPGTSVHWYGKQVQNKRKLGHITITGTDNQQAQQRLRSIDSAAADAMDQASYRYTEATSKAQHTSQTPGWLKQPCCCTLACCSVLMFAEHLRCSCDLCR